MARESLRLGLLPVIERDPGRLLVVQLRGELVNTVGEFLDLGRSIHAPVDVRQSACRVRTVVPSCGF